MTQAAFELLEAGDLDGLKRHLAEDRTHAAARNEAGISLLMQSLYLRKYDMAELIQKSKPPLDLFEHAALGNKRDVGKAIKADSGAASARSPDGFTALHLAAFFGQEKVVDVLLKGGADVNSVAANDMQVQPLHSAVACGSERVARRLLAGGADANAKQMFGYTPLHAAANQGSKPLVELLLANGADPSTASDDGKLPADLAEASGHPELVAQLQST